MLRLADVPAKLAYEVHLELKSRQSAKSARELGTSLFGHYHNDHLWVLFHDGQRWKPFDSALGIVGYDEFAWRWTGEHGVAANPPFVIWEETGRGMEGMEPITHAFWEQVPITGYQHNNLSAQRWQQFVAEYGVVDRSHFDRPITPEFEAEIATIARSFFALSPLSASRFDASLQPWLIHLDTDGKNYFVSEQALNALGYAALNDSDISAAVAAFRLNCELFPESWNAWDSLGEGLVAAGDVESGMQAYRKSLELNPNNSTAREIIEKNEKGDQH